jgi:hypothetical protein
MSYHTHNLKPGDVFSAPHELEAYGEGEFDPTWVYHRWEVVSCERRVDGRGSVRLVAVSLDDGSRLEGVFNGDISLCMVEDE